MTAQPSQPALVPVSVRARHADPEDPAMVVLDSLGREWVIDVRRGRARCYAVAGDRDLSDRAEVAPLIAAAVAHWRARRPREVGVARDPPGYHAACGSVCYGDCRA